MGRWKFIAGLLLFATPAWAQEDDAAWQEAQPPPPPFPPAQAVEEEAPPVIPFATADNPTDQELDTALQPYGHWVDTPEVGRAWQPWEDDVGDDFTPYESDGQWDYTDAGWQFQSALPFGFVVFHYGRWYQSPSQGWVWTVGHRWAPAWVDWRYGNGYVAWRASAPRGQQIPFHAASPAWSVVHRSYFGQQDPGQYAVPVSVRTQPGWWRTSTPQRGSGGHAGNGTHGSGQAGGQKAAAHPASGAHSSGRSH